MHYQLTCLCIEFQCYDDSINDTLFGGLRSQNNSLISSVTLIYSQRWAFYTLLASFAYRNVKVGILTSPMEMMISFTSLNLVIQNVVTIKFSMDITLPCMLIKLCT